MIIAALAAEGKSEISGVSHIDRGYQRIEHEISAIGGKIKRENK